MWLLNKLKSRFLQQATCLLPVAPVAEGAPPGGRVTISTSHPHRRPPQRGAPPWTKHGSYTQDTKRLKRGPLLPHPGLPSEHTFVSKILTGCRSTEQSRFAIAYR
ncbi:hypothetical protein M9458_011096, partial [Cirrhinus mrigala]